MDVRCQGFGFEPVRIELYLACSLTVPIVLVATLDECVQERHERERHHELTSKHEVETSLNRSWVLAQPCKPKKVPAIESFRAWNLPAASNMPKNQVAKVHGRTLVLPKENVSEGHHCWLHEMSWLQESGELLNLELLLANRVVDLEVHQ